MDEALAVAIREAVSWERLGPYVDACDGDLRAACRLYAWNLEISAAFLGPLALLEIVVRNAVHRQLAELTGQDAWWRSRLGLRPEALDKIEAAHRQLRPAGRACSAGRVVAELSFGFWVALLRREYEMTLWRPALHRAFPGYHGRRGPLHEDLRHMSWLRNRIAHHEPIHHRHLSGDHDTMIRLIGHVCAETSRWVRAHDRVLAVLSRRAGVRDGALPIVL